MPNGTQWNPPEKQINKYDKVTILPASGWLEIYPSDIDSIFFQSSDISNNILENGKVLWTSETGEAGNINYSSSAISEDAVYTVSLSGEIYAYEKENGKQIWSLNIGDNSIEPAVSKELVFVGSERGLHAIDKDTGRIKWEKLVGEISSKPVVSEDLVITSCSDGNIYCYSIDSGEKKWSYEFGEGAFISDVQQGKIYAGSGNSCYAFDISKESVIWEYETDKKITASPKISGNTVYVGSWDGNLYAINSVTGFLKWKYQTGWAIDSTPDVSDNTVVHLTIISMHLMKNLGS